MPEQHLADDAIAALSRKLGGRGRVYIAGSTGESPLLAAALERRPEAACGLTFIGVWIPGINRVDYAGLHETARSEVFFVPTEIRDSFEAGKAAFRPLSYSAIYPWLERTEVDAALLHVSPPDDEGMCSLGVAADFSDAVMHRAPLRIAHVNPAMPVTRGAPKIAWDDLHIAVEAESPLLTHEPGEPPSVLMRIARHAATLVDDGATVQFGLGRLQPELVRMLTDKRDLRIHSGMVTSPVLDLMASGTLSAKEDALTTGTAVGGPALYRRMAEDDRVRFAPVSHTHDIGVLRSIEKFTAVNSVIEVDLLGQANAEILNGWQISGPGGIGDFLRGARLSPGGRPIAALASTAAGGTISRIVPALARGVPPTVCRGDIGFVVTEHGIADLRTEDLDGRAEALLRIADPEHRENLRQAWKEIRKSL